MGKAANTWRSWIGERGIDLAGLDGATRRVIATTYAVLLGLALATALHDWLGASGHYYAQPGIAVPKAVAWLAGGGMAMAVTLLFAGAAHARTRWKYFLIAPVLLAIFMSLGVGPSRLQPPLPTHALLMLQTPLLFLPLCVMVVVFGPRLRTRHVLAIMAVLVACFAATVLRISVTVWQSFAPSTLAASLYIGSACIIPALVVVGWDLAEIGADGGRAAMLRGARQPLGRQRLVRIALLVGVFAVAFVLHLGHGYDSREGHLLLAIWVAVLLAAAAAGVWLAARRPAEAVGGHLNYRQVMLLAIPLAALGMGQVWMKLPDPRYFTQESPHEVSVVVPEGMMEKPLAGPAKKDRDPGYQDTRLHFQPAGKTQPSLTVAAIARPRFRAPNDPAPSLNELLQAQDLSPITVQLAAPDAYNWRTGIAHAHSLKGGEAFDFVIFKRENETGMRRTEADWYVMCGTPSADLAKAQAMCEHARLRFRQSVVEIPWIGAGIAADMALFAASAAAFVLAAVRARRKQGPLLDLMAWGLLLAALNGIGGYAFGGSVETLLFDTQFTVDLLVAVLLAAGVVGVIAEVWTRPLAADFQTAGLRNTAAQLNATLLIMAGVLYLYVFAASQSEHSQAVRGLVVCLALTWELATAGATVNAHGTGYAFPRTSRILIFVGYLILVATCVFFFGKMEVTFMGASAEPMDTESIVSAGLVLVGAAFVISHALRSLPGLRAPVVPVAEESGTPG